MDQPVGHPAGPGELDAPVELDRASIGWGRAVGSGLAVVVLGLLVCVYLPNYLVTHLSSWTRDQRAGLATVVCFAGLAAIAWLLRRLQARGVI